MYKSKRLLAVLTAALMVLALLPAVTVSAEMTYDDYEFSNRTITAYLGSGRYVAIPERIDGTTVSTIGESAFYNTEVRYISIPTYVTKIEDYAFADCYGLERVYIPSSVKTISSTAFDGCDDLIIYAPSSSYAYTYALDYGINRRAGTATTVTLTLNPGTGGTVSPSTLTVTRDFEYGELPIPSRSGYAFEGWYTSSSGGEEVTWDTIVEKTSSHTVYAHWYKSNEPTVTTAAAKDITSNSVTLSGTVGSAGTYTVGFELENLTEGTSKTFNMGSKSFTSGSRTFAGKTSSLIAGNRYRYRAWAQNSYGTGYGSWVTFTAQAAGKTYTVTFNVNGGDSLPSSERTKEIAYGDTYGTLPTPTRSGYIFEGWFTGTGSSSEKVTSGTTMNRTTNHTLYAHWAQVREYTVTFNPNGGDNLPSYERTKEVTTGDTYGDLPVPYRDGYHFDGWYTSSSGGDLVTSSTKVTKTANHTLYAHWIQIKTYNVTFNANGGTLDASERTAEVTVGQTYGYLPEPTRSNYTFAGWYTSSSASATYTDLVTEYTVVRKTSAHTLYARWSPSTAPQVTTDEPTDNLLNGTLDSIGSSRVTEFGFEVLNTTTGEVKAAKADSSSFSAGRSYYITVNSSDSSVVYLYRAYAANSYGYGYGQWVEYIPGGSGSNGCTVTFNVNGGNTLPSNERSKTVYRGETYGVLPEPTRSGYVFDGWFTSASGGTQVTADTQVTKTSAHTLYAHWTKITSCTVTFNANGGNTLSSAERTKTVTYGSTYGVLPVPTRSNYTFLGWYTASGGGTPVTAETVVTATSNHTLYAHWAQGSVSLPTVTSDAPTDITTARATINGTLVSNGGGEVTGFGFDVKNNDTGKTGTVRVVDSDTDFSNGSHHVAEIKANASTSCSYRAWADNSAGRGYGEWVTFRIATGVLTFDANGGTVTSDTKYVTKDEPYGALPVPVYSGYTFDGWYTTRTGGSRISESTVYSGTGNQTVYAHWTSQAETPKYTADLTVGTVRAASNGTVTVPLVLANNPGLASFLLTVHYDKTKITPASAAAVSHGPDMSVGSVTSNIQQGDDMSSYDYVTVLFDNPTNFTGNGVVINITFKVAANVAMGANIPITVEYDRNSTANENEELVGLNITNGAVNITNRIPGDVNGDGDVDARDCIRLGRYLAELTKVIDMDAANVNGDGDVDLRDGIRLRQKLAGWNVSLQEAATAAAGKTVFSADRVMANAGGFVEVPVSVTQTDGMAGFSIRMYYDKTKLTPVSVSFNNSALNGTFSSNTDDGGDLSGLDYVLAVWFGAGNTYSVGNIFTVRFKVADGAAGEIPITLDCSGTFDQSENTVETEVLNGGVTITDVEIAPNFDYSINSVKLNGSSEKGSDFDVSVTANTDYSEDAVLVLAAYSDSGELLDMATAPLDMAKSVTDSFSLTLNSESAFASVKAFVWDSLTGMTPLSRTFILSPDTAD